MPEEPAKRVLVTGAGSGIGRAVALRLLGSGFDVAVLGRKRGPLEDLASRAVLMQRSARVVGCDLADRAATDRALEDLTGAWPSLHGVVLNAGISELSPLADPDTRTFDRLLEINLSSCFRVLRILVPRLSDGGRVVAIGSVLGRFGIPHGHGYCASKAGLMGLVRALALDLAPRGITANAVLPGWVDTPLAEASIARQAPLLGRTPAEARDHFARAVPIGRFLDPAEVARMVAFLVGTGSEGITGQALNICGGVLA